MTTTLELRYSPQATGEVAGWFLSGSDSNVWLAELARCELTGPDVQLFIVPQSINDPRAAGVMVLPKTKITPKQSPAGLSLRRFGERLLIPVDATIHPPISNSEALQLCHWPVTFFHPTLGLTGFDPESTLHVWDLLRPPEEGSANWNYARAAEQWPMPFRGIVVTQPPTPETMFGEESRDIGSEADHPIAPTPGEPSDNFLSKAGMEARRRMAEALAKAINFLPQNAAQRTWLNDIQDWAMKQAAGVAGNLDKLRNKELHRLLDLLRNDPDAGLRHAIPFNGFGHRGRGTPGAQLGNHNIDFNLGNLGGQAADFWNVPPDLQELLIQNYRELANREIRLGRHRRAAYIYAELLGDLNSAANALKQGGYFREAAVLYEDRLKNPLAAAECFAEAGMLREAIERYEKLERFLDVADLYLRLGEAANAEAAVRRVIQGKLQVGDVLEAAKLLEQRLRLVGEAAELLREAWPASRQAFQCLDALFELYSRHSLHEDAARRVAELRTDAYARHHAERTSASLAQAATRYPDERVRFTAADLARVFVAHELSRAQVGSSEAMRVVQTLNSLAPQDRLLARDGNRYLTQLRTRELPVKRRPTLPSIGTREPTLLRRIELPRQIQWFAMRSAGRFFFAAGHSRSRLTVARGLWTGEIQTSSWACESIDLPQRLIFEPVKTGPSELIVSILGTALLKRQIFPATDLFYADACLASTPDWFPRDLFPVVVHEGSVWSVHVAAGRAVLSCFSHTGRLLSTSDISDGLLNDATRTEATRLSIAANRSGTALALGDRLYLPQSSSTQQLQLPAQATKLISTLPHTREAFVVLMEHGAALHWHNSKELTELDRDMLWRDAAWTRSGKLVLLGDDDLQALDVDSRGVHAVQRKNLAESGCQAVVSGGEPNEFAVLYENGQISIFKTE
jgi:tetratricopeptide (TPR) repeat protein